MHPEGNVFSVLVILLWIPAAIWIARRWPPARAAALSLLIPVMFLPEDLEFKVPGLPEFHKERIAIFLLLIAVLIFHRQRLASARLGKPIRLAILFLVGGSIFTVLLNFDPIHEGAVNVPSLRPYDIVHILSIYMLDCILPFVLAVAMFNGPKDLRVFLRLLVVAALAYSVLQIFEIRFSPQLHRGIYGYHQHGFGQAKRGGGFRPMVFMQNGLAVAVFTVAGILAASGLHRVRAKLNRVRAGWALAWLWAILYFSKSVAAFLYALVAVPLVLFTKPRMQVNVAVLLAIFVLAYPEARAANLIPVDDIMDLLTEYRPEKVSSVSFRFENEEKLLNHAKERSFFGWGHFYCRRCIRDQQTGKMDSVSDGDWIKAWGGYGRVGFYAKYLLLLLPIFFLARRLKYVRRRSDRQLLAALALIVGFSVFDLLPNGNFNYLVFVFSGVLMGCSEGVLRHQALQTSRARHRKSAGRVEGPSPAHELAPDKPARW